MAFSGLSIVAWALNWVCWKKKFCCCKVYHNPIITRIFWWISFSLLSGIIACCFSGLVFATRFGKYIRVVQCIYERIYYDIEYGELSGQGWQGLTNNALKLNETKKLIDNNNNIILTNFNLANINLSDFKETLINFNVELNTDEESKRLKCLDGVNQMTRIIDKVKDLNDSIKELNNFNNPYYINQLNKSVEIFYSISKDLKNYKNGYLDKVEYYVKVGKGCGYILVMIYFSLLSLVSICGIVLLLAYTFLSNQGNLDTFMHIAWNSIRFFVFSFLMYSAAFAMLYKGLRDLIPYNKFLFGQNLKESNTYVLPKEEAKDFLKSCLCEEKSEYKGGLDSLLSSKLNLFFFDLKEFRKLLKEYSLNNFQENLRYLDSDETSEDTTYETSFNNETIRIITTINNINTMLNKEFNEFNKNFASFIDDFGINDIEGDLSNSTNINSNSNSFSNSYDCKFLKSHLNLLYNSLYDLSVESRILYILSCCIGFFGEALIYFYLLSMYHYNKTEFKEGNLDLNKSSNKTKNNIEEGSRNEFLDKNKPANMRKFNKYLDKDFNKDFSTSVRKGLK